jgi:hypothetical protein
VRIAVHVFATEPDPLQQLLDTLARLGGSIHDAVDAQRFADDASHRHTRVQRRVGVLEDDLHLPAQLAQVLLLELEHV